MISCLFVCLPASAHSRSSTLLIISEQQSTVLVCDRWLSETQIGVSLRTIRHHQDYVVLVQSRAFNFSPLFSPRVGTR
ncbi:hypothetical protein F5883DRAFT_531594 [Diaporthe sp. PMI_573]|nr:hypothetical protein F5883DRAFT_531594 [Diaporthaceae sp. PMI_573]